MLTLTPIEILFRAVPECFITFWAIFVFSMVPVDKKRYLKASIIGVIGLSIIRMLPVHYGVHSIVCAVMIFVVAYSICKVDLISSCKSSILAMIIQLISEGINIFLIENVFGLDLNALFDDRTLKVIYGVPSLVIYAGTVFIFYYLTKGKYKNYDKCR